MEKLNIGTSNKEKNKVLYKIYERFRECVNHSEFSDIIKYNLMIDQEWSIHVSHVSPANTLKNKNKKYSSSLNVFDDGAVLL
jgi:hypothetical protein